MIEKEDLKEKIANHFKTHFNHFGFKKTSVDDIAKELKISKKTIYQFFSSKEKIFYHVVSKIARGLRNKMEKELENQPTYAEKINQLIILIFKNSKKWLREHDAFEFKYKYEIGSLAFKDAFSDLLKNLVDKGMKAGEFPKAPLDLKVRFIQGIITESMNLISMNPDLKIEPEVITSIFKLLS